MRHQTYIRVIALASVVPSMVLAQPPKDWGRGAGRPFVELAFERLGDWTPMFKGEPTTALWFRAKNNCPYPIEFATLPRPNKNPGPLVMHTVRRVSLSFEPPSDWKVPDEHSIASNYASIGTTDGGGSVEVMPGKMIRFGIPSGSITRFTYIQIEFDIQFPWRAFPRQPGTYLSFFWIDLPSGIRAALEKHGQQVGK